MSKYSVYHHDGKWYFYDETWSDTFGPYDSQEAAEERLKKYIEFLNRDSSE